MSPNKVIKPARWDSTRLRRRPWALYLYYRRCRRLQADYTSTDVQIKRFRSELGTGFPGGKGFCPVSGSGLSMHLNNTCTTGHLTTP